MKKLYYGILGENAYNELAIPENIVDVKVITKENGIFLQYLTEFDKKINGQQILQRNIVEVLEHFTFTLTENQEFLLFNCLMEELVFPNVQKRIDLIQ